MISSEKGIKTEFIRKTGRKASRSESVGTTGRNAKKWGQSRFKRETYGHPALMVWTDQQAPSDDRYRIIFPLNPAVGAYFSSLVNVLLNCTNRVSNDMMGTKFNLSTNSLKKLMNLGCFYVQ